jgi:Na+-translocating ferredoxin:NAD+ oxidoreductase RnfC subunit
MGKHDRRAAGLKFVQLRPVEVHPMKEYRRVPLAQLRRRLQVEEYEKETPYDAAEWQSAMVRVRLKQHAGEPAVPVVEAGRRVKLGQIVGRVADGKLGAHVHASIDGTVRSVTADAVEIVA